MAFVASLLLAGPALPRVARPDVGFRPIGFLDDLRKRRMSLEDVPVLVPPSCVPIEPPLDYRRTAASGQGALHQSDILRYSMRAGEKRVLVLGGAGMLGHKVVQLLSGELTVVAGVRSLRPELQAAGLTPEAWVTFDAMRPDTVAQAIERAAPDVIVNAVGVIKQSHRANDDVAMVATNSLFPHVVAKLAAERGARVVHLSTDCVFSGKKGQYTDADVPDATDLYGRSKLVGELTGSHCITLRTSMIGRELYGRVALAEWFLQSRGTVKGFKHAVFSGLTTPELSRVIRHVVLAHPTLSGVYQVAADPIDKYALLALLRDAFGTPVDIEPEETFVLDRSLNGSRFRAATGYVVPDWPQMIHEMKTDPTPYDAIHAMSALAEAL